MCKTLRPAWYQGRGKKAPYFEGWYFKLVDPSERHRLAVIPGVFRASNRGESHAFIQVLDSTSGEATYHEHPVGAFGAARQGLDVQVGASRFTLDGLVLEIESPERCVKGRVSFRGITPWPVTLTSPGAMGWFAWVPFLQTYHGVLSLDHVIHGALSMDGETIDFGGGRGYIEKDWGRSFPDAWVWMQTNHFGQPGISLTISVATIPWLGTFFRGFIMGLWHANRLYRFATYTGARIEDLGIEDEEVHISVSDRDHRLEVTARRARGGILRGPTGADMRGRVTESLEAAVVVRLSALRAGASSLIFGGIGRNAGLEIVGDQALLTQRRAVGLPTQSFSLEEALPVG
ncbi:MAG: tocopherol cyclase family protein [Anaerolineae bacterium]